MNKLKNKISVFLVVALLVPVGFINAKDFQFAKEPLKGITHKDISNIFDKCEKGIIDCKKPNYKDLKKSAFDLYPGGHYIFGDMVFKTPIDGLLGGIKIPAKIIFDSEKIYLYENIMDKSLDKLDALSWAHDDSENPMKYLHISEIGFDYEPGGLFSKSKQIIYKGELKMTVYFHYPKGKIAPNEYVLNEYRKEYEPIAYLMVEYKRYEKEGHNKDTASLKKFELKEHYAYCFYNAHSNVSIYSKNKTELNGNLASLEKSYSGGDNVSLSFKNI